MGLSQGVRLGPYQIVALLGAGGMGTVYKATDTRLGRTVAIKVLADRASCDPQQRLRFEQEARAVSTLSHPNICVLYDVGCETPSGGCPSADAPSTPSAPVRFLVMEHLEGETLSKRLREGGVTFDQALDIGAQVADALAKAHHHGVIHRDLKPGNIMLTRSGAGVHAKLLDFGLAKMRQTPDPDLDSTHSNHEIETRPGAMLGTLPYMPPEQLDHKAVDGKADIFALGCVLYEMLTGRRAFRGDSEASLISAIMTYEPEPVASLVPATPAALDHLIRRCLQKDPERRSESAHDLAEELRWLRDACRSNSNSDGHPKRRVTDSVSNSGQQFQRSEAPTPRPRTRRVVLAVSLLGVAVASYAGVAYRQGWWPWQSDRSSNIRPQQAASESSPADPFRDVSPQQVTSQQGLAVEPAISPDANLIAYTYVSEADPTSHIWLAETSGTASKALTEGPDRDSDPAWNPDGTEVLFTRHQRGARLQVMSVQRLGGRPRPLVADATEAALSEDGRWLAFVREVPPGNQTRVFVASMDSPSFATQLTHAEQGLWDHRHPSWSPDGNWLCYHAQYALWIISCGGGGSKQITPSGVSATDPIWSRDGRWVYYTSTADGLPALWKVSFDGGTPQRVRSSSGAEREPSLSRDGMVLAFSTGSTNSDLVLQGISQYSALSFGQAGHDGMPVFVPGATAIVYVSGPTPNRNELRVRQLRSGRPLEDSPLTRHGRGEVDHPSVSADGRFAAYYRVVNGLRDIWVIRLDGGQPVQITTGKANNIQPAWSPNGTRLAFVKGQGDVFDVWTIPVEGGIPTGPESQVTRVRNAQAPVWSPDGVWIAYVTVGDEVWVVPADGLEAPRPVTKGAKAIRVRWPRQDQMVVSGLWDDHTLSLRLVNPLTGQSKAFEPPLVLGTDTALGDFDIDLDRKLVVFAHRGKQQGNIHILNARR